MSTVWTLAVLTLERLACDVVACWERGDLAAAVHALDRHLQEIFEDRLRHLALIERAIDLYADDDFDIDVDDTFVSRGKGGAFVMGWRWVPWCVGVSPADGLPITGGHADTAVRKEDAAP